MKHFQSLVVIEREKIHEIPISSRLAKEFRCAVKLESWIMESQTSPDSIELNARSTETETNIALKFNICSHAVQS